MRSRAAVIGTVIIVSVAGLVISLVWNLSSGSSKKSGHVLGQAVVAAATRAPVAATANAQSGLPAPAQSIQGPPLQSVAAVGPQTTYVRGALPSSVCVACIKR
jgi:hypothetical protein